jgi:hypothetical protein
MPKGKNRRPPLSPEKVAGRLNRAQTELGLIAIRRWIPDADVTDGFVVAQSDDWILLAILSDRAVLDGWIAVRRGDIQSVTRYPVEDSFEIKALQARGQWPPTPPDHLQLLTTEDVLSMAAADGPTRSAWLATGPGKGLGGSEQRCGSAGRPRMSGRTRRPWPPAAVEPPTAETHLAEAGAHDPDRPESVSALTVRPRPTTQRDSRNRLRIGNREVPADRPELQLVGPACSLTTLTRGVRRPAVHTSTTGVVPGTRPMPARGQIRDAHTKTLGARCDNPGHARRHCTRTTYALTWYVNRRVDWR